jgi:tRNA-dihydrouridine synthase
MTSQSIEVLVASLEEAEAQIAEFWVDGVFFGQTLQGAAELAMRIEPRADGQAWDVSFAELRRSLDRAAELLRLQPSR